jgi:hypothetical protein
LRHANRRVSQIVSQLQSYRVLVLHALDTLCILLRSGLARHYTLQELVHVLIRNIAPYAAPLGVSYSSRL